MCPRILSQYRAQIRASSSTRGWAVDFDTGYLASTGAEKETTASVQYTWFGLPLEPSDTLTISLVHIARQSSTSWPQLSLQFSLIRTDLNVSYESAAGEASYISASWLYGFSGNRG